MVKIPEMWGGRVGLSTGKNTFQFNPGTKHVHSDVCDVGAAGEGVFFSCILVLFSLLIILRDCGLFIVPIELTITPIGIIPRNDCGT